MDAQNVQSKASRYITGGMSSSFRANRFNGVPMYARTADGPRFKDIDGKEYIDFFMCHGAVLLGHNRPEIRKALSESLDKGFYAGYDSLETIELARKICEAVPAAEQLRFVNSGSEGTLLALRLARGYTGRSKIIRMDGHFHGVHDYLLANNLVSKVDFNNPGDRPSKVIGRTAGIPDIVDETIITLPWKNLDILRKTVWERHDEIAGIIMNVIDFNNGCIGSSTEYLSAVRELADEHGIVLIFDEILSGFKTGLSCAQGYYGVTPDVCTLGKALTNDVPMGVVAGKKKIMDRIMDPDDPVIAGGTFSGNQLGVAAGNATMDILSSPDFYEAFLSRLDTFFQQLQGLFNSRSFPAIVQHIGAGFSIYFGVDHPVETYRDYLDLDSDLENRFFLSCLQKGLYFHTDFTVSATHDEFTLAEALERFESVINDVR